MIKQKIISFNGICLSILLLFFVLTKYFGFLRIEDKATLGWLLFTSLWAVVFLMLLYSQFIEKKKFLLWGELKRNIKFYVFSILGIFATIVFFGILKNKLGFTENTEDVIKNEKFWQENYLLFIYMGITAGFAEELLFRGYILPRLEFITQSKWFSIIVSSILFAIAHFANSDINKMYFLFIFGIIFSIHYYRYRNILVLGITHCLTDIISL
jgi:membrane protease YdiL (CAAX protease family)